MMAALSSLRAGKSPAAANPDRVAAQDGEAADTDVLLSSGETPFANLLEGELPQVSDPGETLLEEVAGSDVVDTAVRLPSAALVTVVMSDPLLQESESSKPASESDGFVKGVESNAALCAQSTLLALDAVQPFVPENVTHEPGLQAKTTEFILTGALPSGLPVAFSPPAGSLPFLSQSVQTSASDGLTLAMATVDEMPKQVASQQIDGVAAMMDADKLQKAELPPVVSGEVRTLSSTLLALGVPALREAQADSRVEWATVPLLPQAEGGKPQALQQLLAERLVVQSSHGMDRALIRLDPPRFGAVEISLQQEGGRLLVQLTASHGEVVRQLQGIGDVLRQELGQRQFHSVQVDIRHGMHDGQQQQQGSRQQAQQEAQPGRALQLDEDGSSGSFAAEKVQA